MAENKVQVENNIVGEMSPFPDGAESVASDLSETFNDDLRFDLLEALDEIDVSGTFASFGTLKPIYPEIFVHDVGPITRPLDEPQAQRLIEKSRLAPYGKGSETIVDTSVRDTWELSPEQFEFRNPEWGAFVQHICDRVAGDLGVNSPFSAHLYKMLLYGKGAMFKPHTDTEKIPGMFATLVVSLPSVHEGGDVVVRHRNQKKVFKTSESEYSYICWYSDVSHQVLPVTSGYRWVLTYNLALDPSKVRPSAGLQRSETHELRHTIRRWLLQDKQTRSDHAYYKLDHEYTQASISLDALKNRDLACVQTLKDISSELPIDIFLALLEKEEVRYLDDLDDEMYSDFEEVDEYEEVDEDDIHARNPSGRSEPSQTSTRYSLNYLVELNGQKLAERMRLDETKVLQYDGFDEVDPEEEYQGYTGNEGGPQETHWYRIAAVVIVPKDSTASFLMRPWEKDGYRSSFDGGMQENLNGIIAHFANASLKSLRNQHAFAALKDICRRFWREDKEPPEPRRFRFCKGTFPEDVITKVIQAAFLWKDQSFFEDAAENHRGNLSLDFFSWARFQFAAGDHAFDNIKNGLLRAVSMFSVPWKRNAAVMAFAPPTDLLSDGVRSWIDEVHDGVLQILPTSRLSEQDGYAAVDMVPGYHQFDYLTNRIGPLVEGALRSFPFVLAFLSRLYQRSAEGALPFAEAMIFYQQIAKRSIAELDISLLYSEDNDAKPAAKEPPFPYNLAYRSLEPPPPPPRPIEPVTHGVLTEFVKALIRLGSDDDDLLKNFIQKIVTEAPSIEKSTFHPLWLPFLHSLISVMGACDIPLSDPRFQQIFIAILKAYIINYVGKEPSNDRNLIRDPVSCFCNDCQSLNRFLKDPTKTVGRFPLNEKRRRHLEGKLFYSRRLDCDSYTEHRGSPYTLVVTKIFKHIALARVEWRNRSLTAWKQLDKFDDSMLVQLLGNDYEIITAGPRLGVTSALFSQSAGVKRKAEDELVDLTGD